RLAHIDRRGRRREPPALRPRGGARVERRQRGAGRPRRRGRAGDAEERRPRRAARGRRQRSEGAREAAPVARPPLSLSGVREGAAGGELRVRRRYRARRRPRWRAGALAMTATSSAASDAASAASAIEVRGLVRRYGDVTALAYVSFEVPRGVVCGLVGPNGAGKTTLFSILATLDEGYGGAVLVGGVSARAEPMRVRAKVGLVPDHAVVYEGLRVDEYLAFFA